MFSTGRPSRDEEEGEQQDFILKLIRQIVQALADIANLRGAGKNAEALVEVQDAYRSLLDMDPSLLQFLGVDALMQAATERGQLEALALLLWEEASIRRELGEASAAASLSRRSKALLEAASTKGLIATDEGRAILAER